MKAMRDIEVPEATVRRMPLPDGEMPEADPVPEPAGEMKAVPEPTELNRPLPDEVNPDNCVTIGGETIEIKPTKLKYFRNRTASVYSILKAVPLGDFLAYEKGVFDSDRNSDQILFDFLVAVFDDAALVTRNYDNLSSEDIERILNIFGRLNHIDEKEERARKNREAQATR